MDRVVQTARGARPSIRQTFHDCVHAAELFDDLRWCILGEGRLAGADDLGHAVTLAQDLLQAIEKEAAAGLADVEQPDLLPGERPKSRRWRRSPGNMLISRMDERNRHSRSLLRWRFSKIPKGSKGPVLQQ